MKNIKKAPYIPTEINIEEVGENRIKISTFPFEVGYAITVAHPIKRLLMSSSVGFAPTGLKIEGVSHEFDSVRGMVEDVSPFIVNLKNIRYIIKDDKDNVTVNYSFKGPMELKGSDLVTDELEVVNGDSYLATINEDSTLNFSVIVQRGIGYVPSENIREETPSGYIPLDAFFTPVKKAIYDIENVLLEDDPTYEKIVFDIETDGQVNPIDAFKEAIAVMKRQMSIFGVEVNVVQNPATGAISEDTPEMKIFMKKIDSLNFSARSFGCLDRIGIKYVGELLLMKESEIKDIKNLGKKSYDEIADKLQELGFPIGTELSDEMAVLINKKIAKK